MGVREDTVNITINRQKSWGFNNVIVTIRKEYKVFTFLPFASFFFVSVYSVPSFKLFTYLKGRSASQVENYYFIL